MDEIIRNFWTKKPSLYDDPLTLDEVSKKRYKKYGLCEECKQANTYDSYCRSCKSKYFQQNFKNWTSGNHAVDDFIQKAQLKAENDWCIIEWIEYDEFEDIEYLAKGGFGTTYKAIWKDGYIKVNYENGQLERNGKTKVALKCLHNSQDITADFLKEVKSHTLTNGSGLVVRCFGITKDPKTNNFIMVMELKKRNLRQHLNENFNSLKWKDKLIILRMILSGLSEIHNNELIHCDLHCGNILNDFDNVEWTYITDLGLCQPASIMPSQNNNKKLFGVLPYVAPEVLRGNDYTQASDIYAFGIIAYEVCTGLPPYRDIVHDEFLAMKICRGLRPNSSYKIPQLIFDIISQCWDTDPSKRPKAEDLYDLFTNLQMYISFDTKYSIIYKQFKEADEINERSPYSSITSTSLSTDALSYTSRLLDFKNLPEPKNADNDHNDLFEKEYSDSTRIDFTKLNINSKDE
ncbi:hypothetical protein RclHR1_04900005 [Rhizophagus clarus]|uniref:Kinase-like domain-containing protein n=1 Tax=Rhizophagus clarus TaxID=94130 RepID=A0A2Z6S2L3_9GLOM|nr:hypothetical protein RclHR1_04900005 [Rhizophagus clarus]GES79908.1 kinase-like domain-containing protein [Rhizophagus clarus]